MIWSNLWMCKLQGTRAGKYLWQQNIFDCVVKYDPDITLYLNANCSKWWQPQVKTERGTEIPSTTQPPSQHHYGLQSHLLSFLTAWLVSPRVYVCNIGHRNLFPHKIAYRKILQWRSQSMMTDQCFANFCPSYSKLPIEERLGRRNTGTYRRPKTL